jgi:hypothetical protein
MAGLALAAAAVAPPSAQAGCGATGSFSETGGVAMCKYLNAGTDTFTVPPYQTKATFDVFGAGGTLCAADGGEAKGDLAVAPFEQFQINVGGPPTQGGPDDAICQIGGWNGGGNGGDDHHLTVYAGSGGAGASDVRTGAHGLSDRLFVGGGGGGNYINGLDGSHNAAGGGGGGSAGVDGEGGNGALTSGAGKGGTQTAGGAGSGNAGSAGFGFGGSGGSGFLDSLAGGSGGGGGWYGGGASGGAGNGPGGGAGGSGHVTSAATNASLKTGGVHLPDGTHPFEEVRAPDNQLVNENGNVVQPPTYGNGEVIVSWDAAPVTASVALSADTPGPVPTTGTVHLTARVTASTGATAVGLVILVDNGITNLGQAYLEADGSVTFSLKGSQLPKATNHITAFYQDYYGVIASVTSPGVDVARARPDQTISFTSTAGNATTDAPYSVSATAGSGLPVSFSIDPGSASVCSIAGATVTFLAAGDCTIDAEQEGDIDYNPAPRVQQQVQVAWGSNPVPVGVSVFGYQTEGGSPRFSYSAPGAPVTISGTLTCTRLEGGAAIDPSLAAGSYTIDLSTCSGLTVPDHYAVSYVGDSHGDFVVALPAIVVTVTGTQTYGGTPTFTYTDDAPDGVTVSGNVTCTSADNGPIYPEMPPRSYFLSNCSGLRAPIGYAITYEIGRLVVSKAVIDVTVSGEQGYGGGSAFTFTDDYPGNPIADTVTCTRVLDGTTIDPSLEAGAYTVDGSSCSGIGAPTGYSVNYAGAPFGFVVRPAEVIATVYGSQTYRGSPDLEYFDNSLGRVTVSGTPTCRRVAYRTPITTTLPVGNYSVEGDSCSGLSLSDPHDFRLTYTGEANGGFVVSPATITASVSGTEIEGRTPSFSYTDDAPAGVGLSGDVTCLAVEGTAVGIPSLGAGTYTIDGQPGLCSGLTLADETDYQLAYEGVPDGFVVTAPTVTVDVSGAQTYGGAPHFTETDDAPPGINLSGTLDCTTVGAGTTISPTLTAGDYTVDGSSCHGLAASGGYDVAYSGVPEGFVVGKASTGTLYNGSQVVSIGGSLVPAAVLSSPAAACAEGKEVGFSLDANPITGAAGTYSLESATADASGVATGAAIDTSGWRDGEYAITASFAGTSSCAASSHGASLTVASESHDPPSAVASESHDPPLTVASPGYAASGHGWYRLAGSGRSNFHFRVRAVGKNAGRYTGKLLLINERKWRIKGRLTRYRTTGTGAPTDTEAGSAGGRGALYWWNRARNAGSGGWQFIRSVSFTVSFEASAKEKKEGTGRFGIRIGYQPVVPEPSVLPNSPPQPLKGGTVKIS